MTADPRSRADRSRDPRHGVRAGVGLAGIARPAAQRADQEITAARARPAGLTR